MLENGQTVYIVLSECGEYSARTVWISAVYLTKEEVIEAIIEHTVKYNTWQQWSLNAHAIYRKLQGSDFGMGPNAEINWAKAQKEAGEEPPREEAERMTVKEIKIGAWIEDE